MAGDERFLTLAEVGAVLKVSNSQTYSLVRNGHLKANQIGGRRQWRVQRSKLEEFIQDAYRRSGETAERRQPDLPE